jgi:hypothetical protein
MGTNPAIELARAYNECARTGTLQGGQLAYHAGGPGQWFPPSDQIHDPARGSGAIPVRWGTRMTVARAAELIRDLVEQSSPWTVEFPAHSIGHASDLIRQSRVYVLTAGTAGRLGYEATGNHESIMAFAGWLESRGIARYLTMHRAGDER